MKQKYVKADMVLNEKGILREFELVIYPVRFVVVIGNLEKEVNDLYAPIDKGYSIIAKPDAEKYRAVVYNVKNRESDNYCLLLWVPTLEDCKGYVLCHEAGHAALDIFEYIGAEVDVSNQEPFTYLLGTLYRLANGAFNEYKDYIESKKNKSKTKKKRNNCVPT